MKKLLYVILALAVVAVVAMFAIGKDYHYEKSIVINAPIDQVYSHASSMNKINEWNPWMKLDPKIQSTYTGTTGLVGDKHCWKSEVKNVGNGCQEITLLEPNNKVSTKISFEGMGDANSDIVLKAKGNQTEVTWSFDSEIAYPMNLMTPFMNGAMNDSFQQGLNDLKQLSES